MLEMFKVCFNPSYFAIKLSHEYSDGIYIRKDIVLELIEYCDLNQDTLLSYTGLNLSKHKDILCKTALMELC